MTRPNFGGLEFYTSRCDVCTGIAEAIRRQNPSAELVEVDVDVLEGSEYCNAERICRVHEESLAAQYAIAEAREAAGLPVDMTEIARDLVDPERKRPKS